MQIVLQKSAGFCGGVERAVRLAKEAAANCGTVYTLGDLMHNGRAVKELEKEGILPVYDLESIPDDATVVIRSHGEAKNVFDKLRQKNARIIDATCPSVRIIQEKAAEYSQNGYFVLIIGKAAHPEVIGIRGWCGESAVVCDDENIQFPLDYDKYFIVAQTTLRPEIYLNVTQKIENTLKNRNKTVEFFNSICYTTIVRQKEASDVAAQCDTVFVVGDSRSSNTKQLYAVAKEKCDRVFLISNVSDLPSEADIKNIAKLGIIAGASTPKELIMEVINRMNQEIKADVVVDDVTPVEAVAAKETNEAVEPAVTAKAKPAKEEKMTMEAAMKRFTVKNYREGMRIKATVVSVDPAGVSVSVDNGGKNDTGYISKDEMELDGSYNPESYPVGTQIEALIIPKTDSKIKGLNLSKKQYDAVKIEDEAVKKILEGEEFSLACTQAIKGGLLGKLGTYTIFVPASQIRMGYVKNLEDYVGKKLRLRILPPKEAEVAEGAEGAEAPKHRANPKRIVASQRVLLEEEKAAREEAFWEVMQVNNIIKGKVKRFTPFGAFVSIMNFDCLAHISDLSWTKIKDPSEVLELNKSYDFVVVKVDRENGKVSLGYKQLQKKPYELAAEKYHVGDIIKGKVERIKDFGAFVEIEPGIDGLVHVSEIGNKWIANANEVLTVGQEIDAKIIGFENNKITLSMKALLPQEPVKEETEEETAETAKDDRPARPSRFAKKFETPEGGRDKRERKPRRDKNEESDEPREWVSSSKTGATFADLFKDIDINKFDDGGDAQ